MARAGNASACLSRARWEPLPGSVLAAGPPTGLRMWAPAKINLDLRVGPRGADGYHPIDSPVVKITLCDRIDLRPRADGRLALSCGGADCGPDEKNLAFRAAGLLSRRAIVFGADIELAKAIPPGMGLGGGSSDAAAVLAGLNELWGLRLGAAELNHLAAALGSDVPLFLGPPASRITGRGEHVRPLAVHPLAVVLCLPSFACPTPAVYRAFDESPPVSRPPLEDGIFQAPPSAWRHRLRNDLSAAAIKVRPELAALWEALRAATTLPVCLSGSGSALFILCDDLAEASETASRIPRGLPCRLVVAQSNPW